MTEKVLAHIIIKSFDFQTVEDFDLMIDFLTVCKYRCKDDGAAETIQNAIYYLIDKRKNRG